MLEDISRADEIYIIWQIYLTAHTDDQLEKLAPWNDDVRRACGNNARKEELEM